MLLPLVALSGVWALSGSTAQSASVSHRAERPAVPPAFQIPPQVNVSPATPGSVAGTRAMTARSAALSGASAWEIPAPALSAYQRGAQIIDSSDTTCNLPWELLAAIGRVESDHGRYAGSRLTDDGVSSPGIFGPALDGSDGQRAVPDTDAGQVDHDPHHDRAVGPMQFLPATWSEVKVDGDGDGTRNPQDIDDAAVAAAVYLCAGTEDLSTDAGRRAALLRYNHSTNYGLVVLRVMQEYQTSAYPLAPMGTYSGTFLTSAVPSPAAPATTPARGPRPAAGDEPSSPAPAKSDPGSGSPAPVAKPARTGVSSLVRGIAADPASALTTAVPDVLGRSRATAVCLAQGIPGLDLRALSLCVTDLLTK